MCNVFLQYSYEIVTSFIVTLQEINRRNIKDNSKTHSLARRTTINGSDCRNKRLDSIQFMR